MRPGAGDGCTEDGAGRDERSFATGWRCRVMSDRLSDFLLPASDADVDASLLTHANNLDVKSEEIYCNQTLGDASSVIPGILKGTARQLAIAATSRDVFLEITAGACRTVFELNIRARLCISNAIEIERFQIESVRDEISFTRSLLLLARDENNNSAMVLKSRIDYLEEFLKRRKAPSYKRRSVKDAAVQVGLKSEYEALYGFYSKYVHATGWLTFAKDDVRESPQYRNIFLTMMQVYAADTYKRTVDAY